LKQGAAVRCVRDENRELARRCIETYAVGDARGFLACLTDDWQLHDADGRISTRAAVAEITRLHGQAFPEKKVEYVHEVAEGAVAQHVLFTRTTPEVSTISSPPESSSGWRR